jgi:lipoyl(octanoyl) transferase
MARLKCWNHTLSEVSKTQNKDVIFEDLGLIDYKEAWDYQEKTFEDVVATKLRNRALPEHEQQATENFLLFCQHPHVYTLGKSGDDKNLLLDDAGLRKHQAAFYKINRGGDITYHGPGQLVGYPIIDLDNFSPDIHQYLRMLEEAIINTLKDYEIKAGRIEGMTGVWLDHVEKNNPRKICAIGVKTSRWVTMHGFAFNINVHLDYFGHIIPCGIADKAVTSLEAELGAPVDFQQVSASVKKHLAEVFGFKYVEREIGE